MKKLSDYKGNEAIELWADLMDPLSVIFADEEVAKTIKSGKSKIAIASAVLRLHSDEAVEILERVDETPVDGLNIVIRLVELINEIGQNEDLKSFFGYAEQEKTE